MISIPPKPQQSSSSSKKIICSTLSPAILLLQYHSYKLQVTTLEEHCNIVNDKNTLFPLPLFLPEERCQWVTNWTSHSKVISISVQLLVVLYIAWMPANKPVSQSVIKLVTNERRQCNAMHKLQLYFTLQVHHRKQRIPTAATSSQPVPSQTNKPPPLEVN